MSKLVAVCSVLACLAIPIQLGAGAQSPPPSLLAYDFCGPYAGEGGWEMWCEVRLSPGDSAGISLMRGTAPAWSPDGLRIAFADGDVFLYDFIDSSIVNLTNRSAGYGPPRWSPDNSRIAFWSDRDGSLELYVINADGSALTRLTDNVGVRGAFAWSPDGTAIAFAATVGGVPELFVMDADGSNPTRLTYDVGFDSPTHGWFSPIEAGASWSSDGTRIVFDCANDICSIHADGTNVTRLTTDAVVAFGGVFSPVDGRIAFLTGRFGTLEVAILEENGAVTRVAPGIFAEHPAWSPGGDRLALVQIHLNTCFQADGYCVEGKDNVLYTVGSDGLGLRAIGLGRHPRFAPIVPGQPAATFTYECTGSSCRFDATDSFDPDGSIASYHWGFGDGTTGSGATPDHQYATAGHYRVTLVVTDNGGATGVALLNIAANHPPVASFTATCSGPTCTFDGSGSSDPDGTIAWYTWTFGDGSSAGGPDATVTHAYATGTFLVTLSVHDAIGDGATTTSMLTVANAVPVASFSVACATLTCTFDASGSSDADSPVYYRWEFGDGATSWQPIATHSYVAAGAYLARLTVTDDGGQTATVSQTVNVSAPPPVTVEMHVGDLDGSRVLLQKTWNAFATIEIHGESHQRVGGVTVSGTWNDGAQATCTTDSTGRCVLSRYGLPTKTSAVTLAVVGAVDATRVYAPGGNHDPDGESNGTSIKVSRR